MTLIDTVGYGDSMELDQWQKFISDYIEENVSQFMLEYLIAYSLSQGS
jgi:septin family protein